MDPFTAAAGIVGLVGTVVAILVGVSNLVAFSQNQAEKRRAKRKQQVTADTPPAAVPPYAELSAPAPLSPSPPSQGYRTTNLPADSTPLIGREQEVTAIGTLLQRSEVRLVTLVGPPGAGKTRLAVKAAATMVDEFEDGVFFVALAALREAALVAPTIGQTLGVKEVPGQLPIETLRQELRDKQMLLVLDNFEQVMPAAVLVTELLAATPRLEVLVTSREPLHVSGEHEFVVRPLALPNLQSPSTADSVTQSPAVTLFVQRTQAAQPDFRLTDENARAVAELCTLLDGLPLAIELAAARSKLFSPQEMLGRLESRFQWLTSGARDLPAHQQTLKSTLDWSYNLIEVDEQILLRRLVVFVGGCSFAAIENVCQGAGDLPLDLLDSIASLIDKSLLQRQEGTEGEPRFAMLESVREYARAKLFESGEAASIQSQHFMFYLNLAEIAAPKLWGQEPILLDRLEQEHDNLRAALQWAHEQKDVEKLARLAVALWIFWYIRGYGREGRQWLEAVLTQRNHLSPSMQATMLTIYGALVYREGELERAGQLNEEALALWRALDDPDGTAWALSQWGDTMLFQEDYMQAEAFLEESLMLSRQSVNKTEVDVSWVLYGLGNVVRLQGDYGRAEALLEEALVASRKIEYRDNIAWSLTRLGQIMLAQGNYQRATALLKESISVHWEIKQSYGLAEGVAVLGSVALAQQHPVRAVQLFGAADKLLIVTNWRMAPKDKTTYDRDVTTARAQLGEVRFRAAWAAGQAMTLEQAVAYALSDEDALGGDVK